MAVINSASNATAPMAIPAIALPESPEPSPVFSGASEDWVAGAPVPDAAVEAEFGDADVVVLDAAVLETAVEVTELTALETLDDTAPPITYAKRTTPTLLVQQALL
ncbi:hypothetical protein EJ02DRAFT_427629 [Clathrospora elynae]|uniref:Uncharacterized protein n=1 Tax=Clathrospora elynae TaxID=706981 RepID=A0A6A5S959_9PLEO|nr:hypothetical protein EJ02DRAFT_427629 [Clathrospora elynae]